MLKERFSNVAKVVPYGGDCITPFVLSLANWLYPTFPTMGMHSKEFNSFEKLVY